MSANELIETLLFFFILSNSAFLGMLFLTAKSKNRRANIFLGLYLLTITLSICTHILSHPETEQMLGISVHLIDPFMLILPLLFFYLLTTLNKEKKTWHYILFAPGLIHSIFIPENGFVIYEYTIYLLEIALTIFAIRILKKQEKNIQDYYSDIEDRSLSWLKHLFFLNVLIHTLIIFSEFLGLYQIDWILSEYLVSIFLFGLIVFMLFWIGYNGFNQSEIFKEILFLKTNISESVNLTNLEENFEQEKFNQTEKTDKVQVECSDEDIRKFNDLKEKIHNQELYIDPKLNLRSLAAALELKENELSRLINQCGNVNFYLFVNQFRVEKFKKLLNSPESQQLSILGLALESGFSSKSTFYKVFKSVEGITPRQYQDSQRKS